MKRTEPVLRRSLTAGKLLRVPLPGPRPSAPRAHQALSQPLPGGSPPGLRACTRASPSAFVPFPRDEPQHVRVPGHSLRDHPGRSHHQLRRPGSPLRQLAGPALPVTPSLQNGGLPLPDLSSPQRFWLQPSCLVGHKRDCDLLKPSDAKADGSIQTGVPQAPQPGPPEPDLRPARPVSTDPWGGFTGVTAEVRWPRHEGTLSPALAGDRPPLCPQDRQTQKCFWLGPITVIE